MSTLKTNFAPADGLGNSLSSLNGLKNACTKNVYVHLKFENIVETLGDSLKPGITAEITCYRFIFVEIFREVE